MLTKPLRHVTRSARKTHRISFMLAKPLQKATYYMVGYFRHRAPPQTDPGGHFCFL
jgi:hypothetical protein